MDTQTRTAARGHGKLDVGQAIGWAFGAALQQVQTGTVSSPLPPNYDKAFGVVWSTPSSLLWRW